MRRISFIVAILGIFVLILLIWVIPARHVESVSDLGGVEDNQRVILSGVVESERNYYGALVFEINDIKMICSGCPSLKGKHVGVEGILEKYEDNVQVDVLQIKILD